MNNKNIIRMEKRATNKVGIFFVLLLSIIGFSVGGYFVYKYRDSFDFTLPWQKQEEEESDIPEPSKDENNTSDGKLHLPEINSEIDLLSSNSHASLYINNLKATQNGYEFDVVLEKVIPLTYNPILTGNVTLKCTKILLDKYEVSPTFKMSVNYSKTKDQAHVIIPLMELENLDLVSFKTLYFFVNMEAEEDRNKQPERLLSVDAYQDVYINNEKNLTNSFVQTDSVRIAYYKKVIDNEATYIYFLVDNRNKEHSHNISLKKLGVNGNIYNNVKLSVDSHYNSKTIFYIKIPKKDYKNVENIDLSFVLTRPSDGKTAIFFTNDKTIDLTK